MASVGDALFWVLSQLYISMYPVGDGGDGGLSLGFGGGGDISPSPMSDVPPPPPAQMSASNLFTRIRTDKGMYINIVAVVCALVIGLQALLGSWRRRFGGYPIVRFPLWACYTISFQVVSYTIGLVQSVGSRGMPDSQLLWAVGMLLLLGSVNGMSAFSRQDIEQSKAMLANHAVKAVLVLWLLYSRSDVSDGRWVLLAYFLLCWIYSIFRMAQRMRTLRMASSAHGLVRSAMLVADYMEDIIVKAQAQAKAQSEAEAEVEAEPKNDMSECKYLVHGEEKDFKPPVGPPYLTKVDLGSKVVTVDMIWNHTGGLLRRSSSEWDSACALKHTCLSFALFKLLKRRFCGGLDIAEAGDQKTMEFVVGGLLADDGGDGYARAFHVVELELSFLYDFFYTKYPALFPTSRLLGVIRFFVLLGFFKVLLLDFMIIDSPSTEDHPSENTFTFFNNVLIIVMILIIDILQHQASGYSNWAIVQYVCDYVVRTRPGGSRRKRCWNWKCSFGSRRALIKLVAAWRWQTGKWWSPQCWDNKLGQYSLLNSYGYSPSKKNALSLLSLRMIEPTGEGRRLERAVPLTAEVRKAVLDCLKETRGLPPEVGHSVIKESGTSAKHIPLLWACNGLPTHTHTVLVWHIATTMCDLDDDHDYTDKPNGDDVRRHRRVATTLSGYCAYLLAFVPDMLPDNSYKATQIMDAVVEEARRAELGEGLPKRCENMFKLKANGVASDEEEAQTYFLGGNARRSPGPQEVMDTEILILAAHLGKQLKIIDKASKWELLARFWAELVLFLAPSNNADVHAEHLAKGGEFITHLWALLTHAGIVERPSPLHASASPV